MKICVRLRVTSHIHTCTTVGVLSRLVFITAGGYLYLAYVIIIIIIIDILYSALSTYNVQKRFMCFLYGYGIETDNFQDDIYVYLFVLLNQLIIYLC